jgi:LacI family gluconate utilization system Gnt-I transcriptional repressor
MHSAHARRRLAASGIPVVEMWDLTRTPIDMVVGFSHEASAADVARFLHERGSRQPALISADDPRARRRAQAFIEAARTLKGMARPAVEWVKTPTTLRHGRLGLARLLAGHPRVDAIFCSSDLLAVGVLTEAHVRGIDVPGRIAVVGFGDVGFTAELHPALTTVRVDGGRIGRTAADFIVRRARGEPVAERIVDVGFSIVQRDSA